MTYQPKWDGFRCLALVDGHDVDLRVSGMLRRLDRVGDLWGAGAAGSRGLS